MKYVKTFESYRERNTMEEYYDLMLKGHKHSGNAPIFVQKVKELLSGKKSEFARSEFRLKMGEQWGLEWIDSLVEHGRLSKIKKGRKEFIVANGNKTAQDQKNKKFNETFLQEMKRIEWNKGNHNSVKFNYDEKKEEFTFEFSEHILTWQHYEKGYGDYTDKSEQTSREKENIKFLSTWYLMEEAEKRFKEHFGKSKFKVSTNRGKIETFGDGHKGYVFTVKGILSK